MWNPMNTIHISVAEQRLELRTPAGEVLFAAPCSTGAAGTGSAEGSGRTPLGRFCICSKHGENAPLNTVFRGRLPVGLHPQASRGEDAILSRILCLHGLEPHNANTRARYIYIHGTADVEQLGTPVSHGCIRLPHVISTMLFDIVEYGTRVIIAEDIEPNYPVAAIMAQREIEAAESATPNRVNAISERKIVNTRRNFLCPRELEPILTAFFIGRRERINEVFLPS